MGTLQSGWGGTFFPIDAHHEAPNQDFAQCQLREDDIPHSHTVPTALKAFDQASRFEDSFIGVWGGWGGVVSLVSSQWEISQMGDVLLKSLRSNHT